MDSLFFDHVSVVVRSLERAVDLYIDTLGGEFLHGGDMDSREMRAVQLRLGGQKLELLQPVGDNSHLHRFLERHGEGFHHVTYLTADLAATIERLESQDYEVVDFDDSDREWKEAYVRPRSAFGTLMQIGETTRNWQARHRTYSLDDVLAGRVVWRGQEAVLRSSEE